MNHHCEVYSDTDNDFYPKGCKFRQTIIRIIAVRRIDAIKYNKTVFCCYGQVGLSREEQDRILWMIRTKGTKLGGVVKGFSLGPRHVSTSGRPHKQGRTGAGRGPLKSAF